MLASTPVFDTLAFPSRAQLGEGPVWDGAQLHWVDILGRRLFSSDLDAAVTRTTDLPQMPGFAVPDIAGGWLAGFPDGLWRSNVALTEWSSCGTPRTRWKPTGSMTARPIPRAGCGSDR